MNEFSELEDDLKKLRPLPPSAELCARIEEDVAGLEAEEAAGKVIRPARFRVHWVSLGAALAAAAIFLVLAQIDFKGPAKSVPAVASTATTSEPAAPAIAPASQFVPDGATQVVYNTRDEGLHFPNGSAEPMRRLRTRSHETWQWRNPSTGASLAVSYPSEQVELIPVSGQ